MKTNLRRAVPAAVTFCLLLTGACDRPDATDPIHAPHVRGVSGSTVIQTAMLASEGAIGNDLGVSLNTRVVNAGGDMAGQVYDSHSFTNGVFRTNGNVVEALTSIAGWSGDITFSGFTADGTVIGYGLQPVSDTLSTAKRMRTFRWLPDGTVEDLGAPHYECDQDVVPLVKGSAIATVTYGFNTCSDQGARLEMWSDGPGWLDKGAVPLTDAGYQWSAMAISSNGSIAFDIPNADLRGYHTGRYTADHAFQDLGLPPGQSDVRVAGINNSASIVAYSFSSPQTYWRYTDGAGWVQLAGGFYINDAGDVAGSGGTALYKADGTTLRFKNYRGPDGTSVSIAYNEIDGLGANGEILGRAFANSGDHCLGSGCPFVWRGGTTAEIVDYGVGPAIGITATGVAGGMIMVNNNWTPARWTLPTSSPAMPSSISITIAFASADTVRWSDARDDEGGFELERRVRTADGTWSPYQDVTRDRLPADSTMYLNDGLTPDATYQYRVRACNYIGCSKFVESHVFILATVPAAPTDLIVTGAAHEVDVAWTDNADNEDSTQVQRRTRIGDGTWGPWQNVSYGRDETQLIDSNVVEGTRYQYRARACNAAGCSAFATSHVVLAESIPTVPSDITASASAGSIDVSWTDASSNEANFQLQRRMLPAGGTWSAYAVIATPAADSTTYRDSSVATGTKYRYRISACNAAGCSAFTPVTLVVSLP